MLLNFIRLDNFKLSILPHVTVEIFEPLLVVRRDDAMSTKKPSPGGAISAHNPFFQKAHLFMKKKMRWVYLEKCLYSPKQALTNNKMN